MNSRVHASTMLKTPFLLALLCAGASSSPAQIPATTAPKMHSLSVEVQSVGNGGSSKVTAGPDVPSNIPTAGGVPSQTRSTRSKINLQVTIRNLARNPDTVKLEWYFVCHPIGLTRSPASTKEYIFDKGSTDVTIEPSQTDVRTVSSTEVVASYQRASGIVTTNNPYGNGGQTRTLVSQASEEGNLVNGWFVRVLADGKLLDKRGSSQTYEDIASDEAKMAAMTPGSSQRRR